MSADIFQVAKYKIMEDSCFSHYVISNECHKCKVGRSCLRETNMQSVDRAREYRIVESTLQKRHNPVMRKILQRRRHFSHCQNCGKKLESFKHTWCAECGKMKAKINHKRQYLNCIICGNLLPQYCHKYCGNDCRREGFKSAAKLRDKKKRLKWNVLSVINQ